MPRKRGNTKVYGIGINDSQTETVSCPFYKKWQAILERCYGERAKIHSPSYSEKGCLICEEWTYFSNFKSWMQTQDWKEKHLDKDLLVKGNVLYSPDTCCFLDAKTNVFLIERKDTIKESKLLRGVTFDSTRTNGRQYRARCSNPFTAKKDFLGYYFTEAEAHTAYWERKLEHAVAISRIQPDERLRKAVLSFYGIVG